MDPNYPHIKPVEPKKKSLIDPIYAKYTKTLHRTLSSTDFYEFFIDSLSKAKNEFQFSNKKMIKSIDLDWVDAVEESMQAMQNIIASPRNVIREEEIIVNVAHAKKSNSESVRHLAQHTSMVENFDEDTGDVRPSKLMQKLRDETTEIYENVLTFTVMEYAHHFVKIRHDELFSAMSDEFGAKLKVKSEMESANELVSVDMLLHIKEKDGLLETDDKNAEIFARISRLHRLLNVMMTTQFAQQLSQMKRAKGNVIMTNALKKNPDYAKIIKLWGFLRQYNDIGYSIKIVEQNPYIDENFERNIYHNILFQYMILKGYLEDEKDRQIPEPVREEKRELKPVFINEIVEELTEDYNLPDVEIRRVLIEQLTKEQLMQEEAEERRRLVEEQERMKREAEEEKLRLEQEAEAERLRLEELEQERIRMEQEAEAERLRFERMEREAEDRRRGKIFKAELAKFNEKLEENLKIREKIRQEMAHGQKDFETAVLMMEEAERRRAEELERHQKRLQEEAEAKERAHQEELLRTKQREERQKALAEERRLKMEALQKENDIIRSQPFIEYLGEFKQKRVDNITFRKDYQEEQSRKREEYEKTRKTKKKNRKSIFKRFK